MGERGQSPLIVSLLLLKEGAGVVIKTKSIFRSALKVKAEFNSLFIL
jgi:hypothetical protein